MPYPVRPDRRHPGPSRPAWWPESADYTPAEERAHLVAERRPPAAPVCDEPERCAACECPIPDPGVAGPTLCAECNAEYEAAEEDAADIRRAIRGH